MITAIALTLFFAAATSALGALRTAGNMRRSPAQLGGFVVALAMATWFAFAAIWLLTHFNR